jgi:catechol-2,3-dioxygenase
MTAHTNMNGAGEQKVKVNSPISLAHVVFRTANFSGMIEFWRTFLGAEVTHKGEAIAFLRYDSEHHRIAIIAVPDLVPKAPKTTGLDHVSFSYETLHDLAETYLQRKSLGIKPTWCINHGPTTSIYYKDPDGNSIETQVDNYESPEEANKFMTSNFFAENPIGTDFDPDELVARLNAGEDERVLKARVEIGPRGLPAALMA